MERYLMYLRKSRMDTDYENVSVAETLSRHRTILENLCKAKKLHVVEVLEEVVSGESLYPLYGRSKGDIEQHCGNAEHDYSKDDLAEAAGSALLFLIAGLGILFCHGYLLGNIYISNLSD